MEETVFQVQIGESSAQPAQFSLQLSIKLGGNSPDKTDPAFQSLLEGPLSPVQPCLVLETADEAQAQILQQTIAAITELPAEAPQGGAIASLLQFIHSQGVISVQTKGQFVVLVLELEALKKERYRVYLDALAAQTKPLQESETTITVLLAVREALDRLFSSENVIQTACKDLRFRLQASLSPHLCQGLSQLALNMSAPDFIQQAFTLFSMYRSGQVSLRFYSYEQLPAAAQALLPSISPVTAFVEAVKAMLGEEDRRVITTLAELMTGSGRIGFNGKFFAVSAEITAVGLSKLILP